MTCWVEDPDLFTAGHPYPGHSVCPLLIVFTARESFNLVKKSVTSGLTNLLGVPSRPYW